MIPILFKEDETEFQTTGIGQLHDTLVAETSERLNGELELYLEYPASGRYFNELKEFRYITVKPNDRDEEHAFRIYNVEKKDDPETVRISASSKSNELGNDLIDELSFTNSTPSEIYTALKAAFRLPSNYNFVSDITARGSTEWEFRSPLNCILGEEGSMIQVFGGEIKRTNDYIYHYKRRGVDRATVIRQDKNLDGFTQTVSTKGLVTKIKPYYTYTPVAPKGFEGVMEPQTMKGNMVTSEKSKNYPTDVIRAVDFTSYRDEIEVLKTITTTETLKSGKVKTTTHEEFDYDKTLIELNKKAKTYFTEMYPGVDVPKVGIDVDLYQLSDDPAYAKFKKLETIGIGDIIDVWVENYGIDVAVKVKDLKYDSLSEKVISLQAGSDNTSMYNSTKAEYTNAFNAIKDYMSSGLDNVVQMASNGTNKIWSGATKPTIGVREGDTWFEPLMDGHTKIWNFVDGEWEPILDTSETEVNAKLIEEAMKDILLAQEAADAANKQIDDAIADAGFASIKDIVKDLNIKAAANNTLVNNAANRAEKAITDALAAHNRADKAVIDAVSAYNRADKGVQDAAQALADVGTLDGRVTTIVSDTEEALERKTSKTDFDDLAGTVTTQGTSIRQNKDDILTKASNTKVDTLTGRVSTAETGITQNKDEIKLKASNADVDTLKGRVSTAESTLSVLPGMIESKVSQTEVDVAIDNISIGGTNIIDNTSNEWKYSTVNEWSVAIPDTSLGYLLEELDVELGDWLTSSIYLQIPEDIDLEGMSFQFRVDAIMRDGTNNMNMYSGGYVTKEGRLINTFQIDDPDVVELRIRIRVRDYTKSFLMGLRRYKLEKGNKVTDWRPSVADTSKLISDNTTSISQNAQEISLRAKQSEVDTLTGRISTAESSITLQDDRITSKVSQLEVDQTISELKIGTMNMVPNSQNGVLLANNSNDNPSVSEIEENRRAVWAPEGNQLSMYNVVRIDIDTLGEYTDSYKVMTIGEDIQVAHSSGSNADYIPVTGDGVWYTVVRTQNHTSLGLKRLLGLYTRDLPAGQKVYYKEFMMTKGNKSVDWSPALIDTQNAISYVESELTQKYDSIVGTVSSIDGRVAENRQTLDGFTQTVSGLDGRVSSAEQTVNSFTNTVSALDGRVSSAEQTVNGFRQSISGLNGKVSSIEQNILGINQTVANKANQSQVTQLADGYNILVANVNSLKSENLIVNDNILRGHRLAGSGLSDPNRSWDMTLDVISIMDGGIASKYLTSSLIADNDQSYTLEIGYFDINKNFIMFSIDTITTSESHTFEPPSNARYIKLAVRDGLIDNVKVEKGKGSAGIDQEARSQISVLNNNINLKVSKGDVTSQINIEANRTLIQSNKLVINAQSTVISGTAYIDGAVIKRASMDGAVIKDATIGSAKIANLDVSKITGNTANFVTTQWNLGTDQVYLDGSGMYMIGSGTWRRSYLSATGFDLYNERGGSGKSGAVGYFKEHANSAMSYENYIRSSEGSSHYVGIAANASHSIVLGYQPYTSIINGYSPAISIDGFTGRIRVYEPISSAGSNYHMNVRAYDGDSGMYGVGFTSAGGGIIFSTNGTYIWKHSTGQWVRF